MPWYAQRAGLPDTHRMWADPGSQLERVLLRLGYVEVPAPGAGQPEETGDEPAVEVEQRPAESAPAKRRAR
ncbi:hypothetical protein [Actinophytocola sediminis]